MNEPVQAYMISEEQCASRISGVCSRCGGKLEPIETEDNVGNPTFWSGCVKCCRFDNGVNPRIYRTAKALYEGGYRHYSSTIQEDPEDSEEMAKHKMRSHLGGTCGLVVKVLRAYETSGVAREAV